MWLAPQDTNQAEQADSVWPTPLHLCDIGQKSATRQVHHLVDSTQHADQFTICTNAIRYDRWQCREAQKQQGGSCRTCLAAQGVEAEAGMRVKS